jgi:hypothetical protein
MTVLLSRRLMLGATAGLAVAIAARHFPSLPAFAVAVAPLKEIVTSAFGSTVPRIIASRSRCRIM